MINTPANEDIVYINKEYVPHSEARISVFDRGFLFADGVYEVIPAYSGQIILLKEHLIRIQNNLDALKINYVVNLDEWQLISDTLVDKNGQNRPLYIQITRGTDVTRLHDYPETLAPTVVAFSLNMVEPGSCLKSSGIKVITLPDIRWKLCHIKSISLLGNIILNKQAKDHGAEEVLLINHDNLIVEGATSNVFMVKDSRIITPALNNELLPGITRQLVFDICKQNDLQIIEYDIRENDLYVADEIWVSSSTKEVRPVIAVNNQSIGNGQPGPVWQKISNLYIDHIQRLTN